MEETEKIEQWLEEHIKVTEKKLEYMRGRSIEHSYIRYFEGQITMCKRVIDKMHEMFDPEYSTYQHKFMFMGRSFIPERINEK